MPSPFGTPISLSSANVYNLTRDPNVPPPVRESHLPISSQTTSGPSSPHKRPSSSNEVEMQFQFGKAEEEVIEDDPEFAGLEIIGLSQWEREVSSVSSIPRSKGTRSAERHIEEDKHSRKDEEEGTDELEESDHEFSEDLIEGEGRVAMMTRSPIAGPSSPPLRTPAYSLPSMNSDLPSGPYPRTPQTGDRPSTPIVWSLSPLSSRGKKENNRSLMMLSDDSDMEQDELNEDSHVSNIVMRQKSPILLKRNVRGRNVILDSDEEESLADRKRRKQNESASGSSRKGKEKASSGVDQSETEHPLLDLDSGIEMDFDPHQQINHCIHYEQRGKEYEIEEQKDEDEFGFDDFPLDDFNFEDTNLTHNSAPSPVSHSMNITQGKGRSKSMSKSPVKKQNQLADQLFPDDEEEEEAFNPIPIPIKPKTTSYTIAGNLSSRGTAGRSIIDKLNLPDEWYIPLIPDLPDRWQEFYMNHWRRGADESKAKSTHSNSNSANRRIGGIVSEDDEEDEDEEPLDRKKKSTSRVGPYAKRGSFGWRGRGRGAWRGGRARGKARRK
ncbi:uncharacterized protein IL334_001945 [Kwoniella shivajii]|uniref:Uncharacterized protein n=1 Tax=Kwoniella shivajii TaxID=564305 RepID=A0ABZ1CTC6_9TREE|nr:hypothetical protein IL334_001945 [Kwoniella shivajii]